MLNKNVIFAFSLGAVAGVCGGFLYFKNKYEKLSAELIDSLNYEQDEETEDELDSEEDDEETEGSEECDDDEASESREYRNYSGLYSGETKGDRMLNNKKAGPKLIKVEEWDEEPSNSKNTLYFYVDDGVLTTDKEEIIENVEEVVGDALTKYGFADPENPETVIFVRNMRLGADYEITKVNASYKDVSSV